MQPDLHKVGKPQSESTNFQVKCTNLGDNYKLLIEYQRQRQTKHTDMTAEKMHQCKICLKGFQTHTGLHSHMKCHKEHRESYPYKCEECNTHYLKKEGLHKHNYYHHPLARHEPKSNIPQKNRKEQKKMNKEKSSILSHPFKCEKCGKRYTEKNNLNRHIRTSHGVSYSCSRCRASFSSKLQKMQHIRIKHANTSRHKCRVCLKVFVNSVLLKTHMETHEYKKVSHKCSICQIQLSSGTKLAKHMKLKHKKFKGRLQCQFCKTFISSKANLARHVKYMHAKKKPEFKCDFCQAILSYPESLERHLKQVHGQKDAKIRPQSSVSSFPSKGNYGQHGRPRHGKSNSKLKCEFCQSTFFSKGNLQRHLKQHHQKRNNPGIRCPFCPSFLSSTENLDRHMKLKHRKNNAFQCHLCPSVLSTKGSLARHLKLSHGKKNTKFNCHLCSSVLPTEGSLVQHLKLSHGENRDIYFKCWICSKVFNGLQGLGSHMRTHSQKRPAAPVTNTETCWQCGVCKRFLQSQTALVNHRKTHEVSGEAIGITQKRYKCFYCDSSFTMTCNRGRHIRLIHQNKSYSKNDKSSFKKGKGFTGRVNPYKCPHCFRSFTQSYHLKSHMRSHKKGTKSRVNLSSYGKRPFKKNGIMVRMKEEFQSVTPKTLVCPVCDKTFTVTRSLKIHIRTHTGEKPFICPCKKSFSQLIHLQKHMKSHLNSTGMFYWKDFTADMIPTNKEDYLSNSKFKMNKPRQLVLKDSSTKSFACSLCNKKFHHWTSLKRHLLSKHNRSVKKKESGIVQECFVRLCRCPIQERYLLKTDNNGNLTFKSCTNEDKQLPDHQLHCMPVNSMSGLLQKPINKEFQTPIKKECAYVCSFCFEEFKCKPTLLHHVKMHLIQQSYKHQHNIQTKEYKMVKEIKVEPGIAETVESRILSQGPPECDAVEPNNNLNQGPPDESSVLSQGPPFSDGIESNVLSQGPPDGDAVESNNNLNRGPPDGDAVESNILNQGPPDESSILSQGPSFSDGIESNVLNQGPPVDYAEVSRVPSIGIAVGDAVECPTLDQPINDEVYPACDEAAKCSFQNLHHILGETANSSPLNLNTQDHLVVGDVEFKTPIPGPPLGEGVTSRTPISDPLVGDDVESRTLCQDAPVRDDVEPRTLCQDAPVRDDVESRALCQDAPVRDDVEPRTLCQDSPLRDDVESRALCQDSPLRDEVEPRTLCQDSPVRDDVESRTPIAGYQIGDDVESRTSYQDSPASDDGGSSTSTLDYHINDDVESGTTNLNPNFHNGTNNIYLQPPIGDAIRYCIKKLDDQVGDPGNPSTLNHDPSGCESQNHKSDACNPKYNGSTALNPVKRDTCNTSLSSECNSVFVQNRCKTDSADKLANTFKVKHARFSGQKKMNVPKKNTSSSCSVKARKLKRKAIVALNRPHLECFVCDLPLHSQESFDEHMRIHTGETPFQCPYCDMTFMRTGARAAHVRILHRQTGRRKGLDTDDVAV